MNQSNPNINSEVYQECLHHVQETCQNESDESSAEISPRNLGRLQQEVITVMTVPEVPPELTQDIQKAGIIHEIQDRGLVDKPCLMTMTTEMSNTI